MASVKDLVIIKGNKEGLIFVLNENCDFEDILQEIQYKLEKSHQQILAGPTVYVNVQLGRRILDEHQKEKLRDLIGQNGNLIVRKVISSAEHEKTSSSNGIKVIKGVVRSGQSIEEDQDVMLLGDVNPGGMIGSKGNLFIMGALRGMAHAGMNGNDQAVIAASYMNPTQLRIAHVISRSPDEWENVKNTDSMMEFAYLKDGVMKIDKTSLLYKIRPDLCDFKED